MFANQLNTTSPTTAQVNCAVTPAGLVPLSISWNGASNGCGGASLLGFTNAPSVNAGFGFANGGIPGNATITVPLSSVQGALGNQLSSLSNGFASNAMVSVPLNTLQGVGASGFGGLNSGYNYGYPTNISGLGSNVAITPSGQIIAR
jgi:hypothetical protein